ncbi:hypothetical protein ACJX0J_042369 [Zea mays]
MSYAENCHTDFYYGNKFIIKKIKYKEQSSVTVDTFIDFENIICTTSASSCYIIFLDQNKTNAKGIACLGHITMSVVVLLMYDLTILGVAILYNTSNELCLKLITRFRMLLYLHMYTA